MDLSSVATIKSKAADEISYLIRLAVATFIFTRASPKIAVAIGRNALTAVALLRKTHKSTLTILLLGQRVIIFHPIMSLGSIILSLPNLAGRAQSMYVNDLKSIHRRFRERSKGKTDSRLRLHEAVARSRKKAHIIFEFRSLLGLNLIEGQATTLSSYAESTELICDFLDFSVMDNDLTAANAREILASSLPKFEQSVRAYSITHALPPRGAFRQNSSSKRPPLLTRILKTDYSMTGFYDQTAKIRAASRNQKTLSWVADVLCEHAVKVGNAHILRFDYILFCEVHQRSCVLLGKLASKSDADRLDLAQIFRNAIETSYRTFQSDIGSRI